MKVYLVCLIDVQNEGDFLDPEGVYSTREKAEAHVAKRQEPYKPYANRWSAPQFEIKEWTLDDEESFK